MKPYYEDEAVTIYNADALDLLRSLPDASIDLIATDPPYFQAIDAVWDNAWANEWEFLRWMGLLCREWRRVLAPSGSLYVFASPEMVHGVERVVRRHFDVLNHITWKKVEKSYMAKKEDDFLRQFVAASERVLFAEHKTSDTLAGDASGYYTAVTRLRRRVFAPLGAYFRLAREAAGLTRSEAEVALGYVSKADPTKGTALYTRWEEGNALPSPAAYDRLRNLVGEINTPKTYQELRQWFDVELAGEFEVLRVQYEGLRRPFGATLQTIHTDVWEFTPVPAYRGRHACEKPTGMMEHIVRTSSRPGDTVLDTFSGSGVTAEAARNLGRRAIVGDMDPHWCRWTAQRLSQNVLDLGGAA